MTSARPPLITDQCTKSFVCCYGELVLDKPGASSNLAWTAEPPPRLNLTPLQPVDSRLRGNDESGNSASTLNRKARPSRQIWYEDGPPGGRLLTTL